MSKRGFLIVRPTRTAVEETGSGDVVFRLNWQTLPLFHEDGRREMPCPRYAV
jgi:hypothetical protein